MALILAQAVAAPGSAVDESAALARDGKPPLFGMVEDEFSARLAGALAAEGLSRPLASGRLAVVVVDLTANRRPRVATLNGDTMLYAASLPKIAILLAAFEKAETSGRPIDEKTRDLLERMIRRSSNDAATTMMNRLGKEYIADVLRSPRYRLYDPTIGGGLWVGKDYAKTGLWRRDPVANLSHGATAMQVARFFYLLDQGRLVSPEASLEMKRILSGTQIDHKFARGLRAVRPRAALYRKSGTWRDFHSDGALVERTDGARYVAVALAKSSEGGQWLRRVIQVADRLVPASAGARKAALGPASDSVR